MSLINCPECNKQISDKAEACPYKIADFSYILHQVALFSITDNNRFNVELY